MRALQAKGFRITAAASGPAGAFAEAGIAFRRFDLKRLPNPWADLGTIRALARLLRELRPDIVQSFDSKLSILLPLAARSAPGVAVIRTINGRGWVFSSTALAALALRPIYRRLQWIGAPFVAATVFENLEDKSYFETARLLRGGRAVHVPGAGADIEGFEQALAQATPGRQLRRELGLEHNRVVICVTRMTRQKGIPSLLAAAALVHRRLPDVKFLLVGPRESEGALAVGADEIERHSPYVVATGPRSDVPSLLRLADVFAFPTEYREGVPRVLCEAALADVPIVTTAIAGCADVIQDGWNGLITPPHAPEALADRIAQLLEHPQAAKVMAERAHESVKRTFGLSLVVAQQAALYHDVLSVGGGGHQARPFVPGAAASATLQ
jgi:glycosyltransferase involved in cell wall biosynthesis